MHLLNWSHQVKDLGKKRTEFKRVATVDECRTVARAMNVLACQSIEVTYQIIPLTMNSYRIVGNYSSIIDQECVVTLDSISSHLNETFDIKFLPEAEMQIVNTSDLECPDKEDPELIINDCLELGSLIYELIASKLELYPRKKGAKLEITESKPFSSWKQRSAFAKLAPLKLRHRKT
ncbi:MAG: hypothetical protein TECD_00140 [Hyphomicrobiaceae bacterium hypho_1]